MKEKAIDALEHTLCFLFIMIKTNTLYIKAFYLAKFLYMTKAYVFDITIVISYYYVRIYLPCTLRKAKTTIDDDVDVTKIMLETHEQNAAQNSNKYTAIYI